MEILPTGAKRCITAAQGDTGANVSATNDLSLLWDYKTLPDPIPITTYSDSTLSPESHFQAIGIGTLKIISNENTVLPWLMLYTPNATGTILSPDHFIMNDTTLHSFAQTGDKSGKGGLTFHDDQDNIITSLNMTRTTDGLWFTTNQTLLPPEPIPSTSPNDTPSTVIPATVCSVTTSRTLPTTEATSSPKQHLWHLWHQRLGHISPTTMHETSKVVEGIPPLPRQIPLFHCPFCDHSKLTKKSGNKTSTTEHFLPGTMFHMDFGFMSGPSNLQDVFYKGHTPKSTTVASRDGHVAYLLIIDAASRYVWVFPVKSKKPPINLIHTFLTRHGQARTGLITTSANGVLTRSHQVRTMLATDHPTLTLQTTPTPHPLFHSSYDQPKFAVRTDNGSELAGSELFRSTIHEHGYLVETTGTDASSMNGKAERPHRTIKERVRCLLWNAGLGVEFWADAILHTVWLYNRTYHTAIAQTPYQAYTRRTPTLDHLITFGAKITAKKAKKRPTALDPNTYNGIFLGYRATSDLIRYWDTDHQQERTAKHFSHDEVHYGTSLLTRPPGPKLLLDLITENDSDSLKTSCLQEHLPTHPMFTDTPITNIDPIKEILTHDPLPYNKVVVPLDSNPPIPNLPSNAAAAPLHATLCKTQYGPLSDHTRLQYDLACLHTTYHHHGPHTVDCIPLQGAHPTLGMIFTNHPDLTATIILDHCIPGTTAWKRLKRWKSRLRNRQLTHINEHSITDLIQIPSIILTLRQTGLQSIQLYFATPNWHAMDQRGIPTLTFDQLNVVTHHLQAIQDKQMGPSWPSSTSVPSWPPTHQSALPSIHKIQQHQKLTRRKISTTSDFPMFKRSEWKQLDRYQGQNMFGEPQPRPVDPSAVILPWVWAYVYKIDPVSLESHPKSRGTCNGGTRHGKVITLAETYAACVEQPAHRLTWALTAGLNYYALGCDVGNAFAEANGPKDPFYMEVDAPFREWWTEHLGHPPIPLGWVVPINKNLQGHPEAPRLWSKHINRIIIHDLHFTPTTHEPCLYYRLNKHNQLQLLLRQVDDFLISTPTREEAHAIRDEIQQHVANPLNDLGLIKRFNGADIIQSQHYIKISCETYITKIRDHHGWPPPRSNTKPLPIRTDHTYLTTLQQSRGPDDSHEQRELETQMGFNYRQVIGELIFAMTLCRIDISFAVILLSQHSAAPAKCHYQAARALCDYLELTKHHGLHYWRPTLNPDLPLHPLPNHITDSARLASFPTEPNPTTPHGASDATWGADRNTRRSLTSVVILLAGAAVYYRTRLHPTIALSSTESELYGQTDAAKAALYIRSILEDLGITQLQPTPLLADNRGAVCIAMSQQPSRRTRHLEIQELSLLNWTEDEKVEFIQTPTQYNYADSLTKATGRIKFYEHHDILMGRYPPLYVHSSSSSAPTHSPSTSSSTSLHIPPVTDTHYTILSTCQNPPLSRHDFHRLLQPFDSASAGG